MDQVSTRRCGSQTAMGTSMVDGAGGLARGPLLNDPYVGDEILLWPLRYRDFKQKIVWLISITGKHAGYGIKDPVKSSLVVAEIVPVRNNEDFN